MKIGELEILESHQEGYTLENCCLRIMSKV